ncbi:uncharacterized protein LOC120015533 isoform X3 [Tripterygium wilfordii]|uniref:uncharacterized protein LOC120015533 isoform X3 n=1 Tax=Tripterygium wilfordii TaxID=458696 RepID=UPI0018F85044|nr:uncharacterized protein LOC120015533 isoform X3 [Tripterygium wilfordii]
MMCYLAENLLIYCCETCTNLPFCNHRKQKVVESRAQLIAKLGDFDLPEEFGFPSLIEYLTTFWEDFTCLDVSQCMVNKTILSVAAKYVDSDLSACLPQFLALATKASMWCGKHLKMTLMSSEESQEEEHCNLFFQLLLDLLSLAAATIFSLSKYPVQGDIVERFILEQINFTKDVISETKINLTKDVVSETKRISSFGSEVIKVVQAVLDGVIRLCKEYCQAVNWSLCDAKLGKGEDNVGCEEANLTHHVINLTKGTIEKLCELGVIAARDGGSLVTILNVSWKGVVSLLQLGEGALAVKVNIADIIVALISLINEPLRCAAEAWSSPLKEIISVTEARRTFLPVKFYLVNAVKICSLNPFQAYQVYKEINLCVLTISTFRILLSHDQMLKSAIEVFAELLEKTSLDILSSILNSQQIKQELKFELLECLFSNECCSTSIHVKPGRNYTGSSMNEVLFIGSENMSGARILMLGRVALFLSFLRYSMDFEDDVKGWITRKLGWLFDILIEEEIYSSILVMKIPVLHNSGKAVECDWQPMLSALLLALKTFMIVATSTFAWLELEAFLLENLFHPHFLCWEIVMELWCFLFRHAEINLMRDILDKFCSLMTLVASESFVLPSSLLRKMARSICMLLNNGTPTMVDFVYNYVVGNDRSQLSSGMFVALLFEGFPLNSLSEDIRSVAKHKIIKEYIGFIDIFDDKLLSTCDSEFVAVPVFAVSASLQSMQDSTSVIGLKTLKFLVVIIRNYRSFPEKPMKDVYYKLFSEMLVIASNMKDLYSCEEMEEVILELHNIFISGPAASDIQLYQCKPYLSRFMEGFGHMEMSETDNCAESRAVWELYHMLFRERNWALVHLAIASFGYFAARTSCNQLWRFVPSDAALSYDLVLGNEANEELFMSELKAFLEKEVALLSVTPSSEQLGWLAKESLVLKEMVQKITNIYSETTRYEGMEIDAVNKSNKRQKLPDGISKGMEMLQSGIKVIGEGVSQWQKNCFESSELQEFLTHFSHLEDVITQFVGLTGNS